EIKKKLSSANFTFSIENMSLDARNKKNIHWETKILIFSEELPGTDLIKQPVLNIEYKKRNKKAVIAGSGPAGYFCALVLQKAGFSTTIIERGQNIDKRKISIKNFESGALFNTEGNYAFGEGGAGTFSDGKLTSRSKHISEERKFIFNTYIKAGAPAEIKYLNHPHLGSDHLENIIKNLREEYQSLGGIIKFETCLLDFKSSGGKVNEIITNQGVFSDDLYIIAPGNSAYDTYRMLLKNGVPFRCKNFALGCRVEHEQSLINKAQWGRENIPGLKAAEYRLTSSPGGCLPVYTFCMCPGGKIVYSAAYKNSCTVNGMSNYLRNGIYANAGCVAGINPAQLENRNFSALQILDWLERMEKNFYAHTGSYKIPACTISDFIKHKKSVNLKNTSYPLGLVPAPLWQMLPAEVSKSLKAGLADFSVKIKGFENGLIMGLESKTSSPIQAVREKNMLCSGFDNLYISGEGSGYSGGIVSSAADGIKTALQIIKLN
ncbi:MAG TPA: FAD-dependent oxidoreductase, partial [Spirochaetia bacterium]|nr:FAD-dependent oxidoreductase [Spirochaetia bacterium]